MDPQEKRKRKPNWTKEENMVLLEEYGKPKNIFQSKFNPAVTNTLKHNMWQEITDKINVRNLALRRSVDEVIKKYENVTVTARNEIAKHQPKSTKRVTFNKTVTLSLTL